MLRPGKSQLASPGISYRDKLPQLSKSRNASTDWSTNQHHSNQRRQVRLRERSVDLPIIKEMSKMGRESGEKTSLICHNTFSFIMPVGRGAYSKVWKAVHRKSGAVYAIKEMSRSL